MCGIWCILGTVPCSREKNVAQLSSRGPESTHIVSYADDSVVFGFTRLAINGLTVDGMQPMSSEGVHWMCNGEIYNWKELRDTYDLVCSSDSDCSVLGPLWKKVQGDCNAFFRALDGVFALALYDEAADEIIIGRDPYGVRPLFVGNAENGVVFASEMKAIVDISGIRSIQHFLPGTWARYSRGGRLIESGVYHSVPWIKHMIYSPVSDQGGLYRACEALRESLVLAVRKRVVNSERPIGALLSGGIDSSLIASLVARELRSLGKGPLQTFSIGFAGSSDLHYARMVADFIGSKHTEIIATPDQFFEAIPQVIKDIESYDITTVRASVGNWLVSKEIAARSDVKVVFNGDGSDEVFGSYLYFYRAPTEEAFEAESERLLKDIYKYDVLRSDRCISSHGLEPRTPFLDKSFVAVARSIATVWRRPRVGEQGMERSLGDVVNPQPEKWILRKAFEGQYILPAPVLWRRKEAFSDGVSGQGTSWYQEIQSRVSVQGEGEVYTHLPPISAESAYYRTIFNTYYGKLGEEVISYFWMPRWSGETNDPSARTLSLYTSKKVGDK